MININKHISVVITVTILLNIECWGGNKESISPNGETFSDENRMVYSQDGSQFLNHMNMEEDKERESEEEDSEMWRSQYYDDFVEQCKKMEQMEICDLKDFHTKTTQFQNPTASSGTTPGKHKREKDPDEDKRETRRKIGI